MRLTLRQMNCGGFSVSASALTPTESPLQSQRRFSYQVAFIRSTFSPPCPPCPPCLPYLLSLTATCYQGIVRLIVPAKTRTGFANRAMFRYALPYISTLKKLPLWYLSSLPHPFCSSVSFVLFVNHQVSWLAVQCFAKGVEGRFINSGEASANLKPRNRLRIHFNQGSQFLITNVSLSHHNC